MATVATSTPGVSSHRTVLYTATHTPPSPLQLQSYEHLRVPREHCYHRRMGTRAECSRFCSHCVGHGAMPKRDNKWNEKRKENLETLQ